MILAGAGCERNAEDDFLAGEIVRPREDIPVLAPSFSEIASEMVLKVPKICYTTIAKGNLTFYVRYAIVS